MRTNAALSVHTRIRKNTVSNLPRQTTALIGRDRLLGELRRLLQDPACRLLTLVGPGGIGKTRLAIAVAELVDGDAGRVVYVPLQAVASADLLASAIAEAAGIMLAGQEPLPAQLLHHLQTKHLLLVLDNFEHLLAGTSLLVDILHEAPHIKLLLTSREALSVREEWRYPVPGLPFPAQGEKGDPTAYGAIQLFADRARQIRPDFDLDAEVDAVLAICRAVEGMPLAIELAASWLTVLDCAAIVERLHRSLDILTTSLRNVLPRHQSMHAVFSQSWQMLTPQERNTFMRLAVFQGGISYAAAEQVADATLSIMSGLVAKSLVRREGDGRYQIHELLRQYDREKLAESPEREEAAHRAHSVYFMQFLADRRLLFFDSRQLQAAREIGGELDNIRKAWQWALDHLECAWILKGWQPLYNVHQFQSRYLEGVDLFRNASHRLETDRMTPARGAALVATLTAYAWLCIRLGRLTEADHALARARQLYDDFAMSPEQHLGSGPTLAIMFLALARGDYAQAEVLGEQVLRVAAEHALSHYSVVPHYGLASAALAQDDYPRAKAHAEAALAAAAGNQRGKTFPLSILGQIALAEDDLPAAKRHFEAAYAIYEACAERGGMAEHLANLAGIALLRQEWREARTLFARSHAVYVEIGDRGGIARTQLGMGIVCQRTNERVAAAGHYRLALVVAVDAQIVPVILSIAAVVGDFLLQTEDIQALGLRALSFVLRHPSCDGQTRKQVLASLAHTGHALDEFREMPDSLPALVAALQAELATATEPPPRINLRIQPLVEPLTAREVEVLHLLAAGRSNPDIAEALIVTVGTVKSHTSRIFRKLDVTNRTQAVVRARALGLLA